jgi:hypothetical protein
VKNTEKINQEIRRWIKWAKYAPAAFAIFSVMLWLLNIAQLPHILLVGLTAFGLTAIIWWYWTLDTIFNLLKLLDNNDKCFYEIKDNIHQLNESFKQDLDNRERGES